MYFSTIKHLTPVLCIMICLAACAAQSFSGKSVQHEVEAAATAASEEKKGAEEVQAVLSSAMQKLQETGEKKINVFIGEEAGVVQDGNYVKISYRASVSDGSPIRLFGVPKKAKREAYFISGELKGSPSKPMSVFLLAGELRGEMGLGKEILGMKAGENKHVSIHPEKAFGARTESKIKSYDLFRKYPKELQMVPKQYYQKFKAFPVLNHTVDFTPYVPAKIVAVEENSVTLSLLAEDGKRFKDDIGETVVSIDDEKAEVTITLTPQMGSSFQDGIIVKLDKEKFFVDYNHPLAGETIGIDLTVEEIMKPSSFGNEEIKWIEDYGTALEISEKNQKPIVLMLYADWCPHCRKMLGGTFEDPWVRYFRDHFVWVKVNSDKDKSFFYEFGQKGYPFTVVIGPSGKIIKKLRGYQKADVVRNELLEILNGYPDVG